MTRPSPASSKFPAYAPRADAPAITPSRNEAHADCDVRTLCGDELLRLLDQQWQRYRSLHELGRKQAPLIAEGQPDALLALLGDKQHVIGELSALNRELEPYRRRWPTFVGELNDEQRSRVDALTTQIGELRDAIVEQDERDCGTLSASRQRIGDELQRMTASSRAAAAYQAAPATAAGAVVHAGGTRSGAPSPRFTDEKG